MAARLEAYRGGQTTPDLDRRPGRLQHRDGAPRELQRQEPDVGRRHGLLPLRPERSGHALRLRHSQPPGAGGRGERRPRHRAPPSAGPGAIVYEQFGSLHLLDLASGQDGGRPGAAGGRHAAAAPALPPARPGQGHPGRRASRPPGSARVFEAHGEILTVPAEKGDIRNITNTVGAAERDPAWSPDGNWIAYFSDESGEYALHLRAQDGLGDVQKIDLGDPPSFFYSPTLVARRQEDRLHRQAPQPLGRGPRAPGAGEGGHRPLRLAGARVRRPLVAGQPLARVHQAAAEPAARGLRLLARRRQERPRSPTA